MHVRAGEVTRSLPFGAPGRAAAWAATAFGYAAPAMNHAGAALVVVVAANIGLQWAAEALPRSAVRRARDAALAQGANDPPAELEWEQTRARIQADHPRAQVVFRSTCDKEGHAWYCAGPASSHVTGDAVVVAMCAHGRTLGESRFWLQHEAAHLTGRRWPAGHALTLCLLVLPPLLGYWAGPAPWGLLWALVAVAGLYLAARWGLELACDAQAQRVLGQPAAVRHWQAVTARGETKAWTIGARIGFALLSTHPPARLRLAVAKTTRAKEAA